jgi:predicted DNA-binding WGR domain protein
MLVCCRRFERADRGACRFWEIQVDHCLIAVRSGVIGSRGSLRRRTFPDAPKAVIYLAQQIQRRLDQGYAEV